MKSEVICDWCGKIFYRGQSQLKSKKHHFCCRQCLAEFSNKSKNPSGYTELKDYKNIGRHLAELNRELNPYRMTLKTRKKIREARLNAGEGKTYTKIYGRHAHRVAAEKILGRPLRPGEVVHHRDGNKRNNATENLVVFESQSDHARHHAELNWFIHQIEILDAEEGGDAE